MKKNVKPAESRKKITVSIAALERMMKTKLKETDKLLRKIKKELPSLEELCKSTGDCEDYIYRFYHQSFKVYWIQEYTKKIVPKLQKLAPHLPLNDSFMEIVRQGTERQFAMEDNQNWTAITRPMLEAYWHARYFLEMVCKYGRELESAPNTLPSGWAAVLYLYNIR